MRIDKFLKVSRIIKRRTIAKEACDTERVLVNDKIVKAGYEVEIGDIITVRFGQNDLNVRVAQIKDSTKKEDATDMFEVIE
ncbi:MAG: RNA-binding S4 domain-containing protein [Clostridiales Family XIII bacterium]|jgi:ribosomal 50S subunit-recycling heat shock protein|nr:RNA-binding S4 domain-containing protein [Clostridiales Family XIII bacterium]